MSRSRKLKYVIHTEVLLRSCSPCEWSVRDAGKPTAENIKRWVARLEESCRPGGVNQHLGSHKIIRASIVNQFTGNTVAAWEREPDITFTVPT